MKQIAFINPENVTEAEAAGYKVRKAARAIVFDDSGQVALLHATKTYYFKLPGGGMENGEDEETALKRECKEEIGCDIKIIEALGSTLEYRKKYGLKQTSYCFFAEVVGKKGIPHLEQDEINEGFEAVWLPLADALKKVRESKPTVYEGLFMVPRDIALLEAAVKEK
jgi:8-oxo-dGTP diphosphatase